MTSPAAETRLAQLVDREMHVDGLRRELQKEERELAGDQLDLLFRSDYSLTEHQARVEQLVLDLADSESVLGQHARQARLMKQAVESLVDLYKLVGAQKEEHVIVWRFRITRKGVETYDVTTQLLEL